MFTPIEMINSKANEIKDDYAKRAAAQKLVHAINGNARYLVLYTKNTRMGDSISAQLFGWGKAYTVDTLHETHAIVAWVEDARTFDDIYTYMQGENWSPNGEARPYIELAGVTHTSMMVGDVIYDTWHNVAWECGEIGWHVMLPQAVRDALH